MDLNPGLLPRECYTMAISASGKTCPMGRGMERAEDTGKSGGPGSVMLADFSTLDL